jgi:hypothetical protein
MIGSAYAVQGNAEGVEQSGSAKIYGKVTEVLESAGYTYAEVDTGSEKVWAATSTTTTKVGDMIAFTTEMPMRDFHSKSMNRDFPLLYFVSDFITDQSVQSATSVEQRSPHSMSNKDATAKPITGIDKVKDGNTIAEVYADQEKLNGQVIRVRGQVTKYTANVMGKNWLHIKDSSTQEDLTITSNDAATLDSVVVIEGKLALDKDFGYGYVYPLIVQDASVTTE